MTTREGHKSRFWKVVIIPIVLVLGIWLYLTKTNTLIVRVTGISWARSVNIEESKIVIEEGWTIPLGGKLLTQQEKPYRNDKVLDHYELEPVSRSVRSCFPVLYTLVCSDRHFLAYENRPVYREVPVFMMAYTYEIERWVFKRGVDSYGKGHSPSPWPEVELAPNERISGRRGTYFVALTEITGAMWLSPSCDYDRWLKFEVGDLYLVNEDELSCDKFRRVMGSWSQ